jgi:hypothetical protein
LPGDYFGISSIPPWEWKRTDLDGLIEAQVCEGLHIDYKESRLLARDPQSKKESCAETLTKGVSAFSNSDGGMIVIGMQTDRKEGRIYPRSLDEGVIESEFNTTWLVQIVNSNISPSIPDLRVDPVKLRGDHDGHVAYVIYIPKGTKAVQAKDLRYYQRIEDQSIPMRDHQIRDVNNRSLGPDLELSFRVWPGETMASSQGETVRLCADVFANNIALTPAELARFTVVIPERLDPQIRPSEQADRLHFQPEMVLNRQSTTVKDDGVVTSWHHTQAKAVQPVKITELNLTIKRVYKQSPHLEPLVWIAESPRMNPKCGSIILVVGDRARNIQFLKMDDAKITLDGMEPLEWWSREWS